MWKQKKICQKKFVKKNCRQKNLLKKYLAKIHKMFFRKLVVGQNSQNVFFRKSGGRDLRKVCTECQPEKNCRFLCTHHSSGEAITWNLDIPDDANTMFRQNVRIFPEDTFFCKTRFVYKCCFQGVRAMCVHIFCRTQKICTKSRNVCTRLPTRKKLSVFV